MALNAESSRNYQDYVPNTEIVQEEDCDTLLISLPGFTREQLRILLTPTRKLKISGERPIGGNKWIRFQKEHPVSTNCDTNKITARFDVGILYIRQPKLITPVVLKDEEKPEHKTQDSQKNETEPQPPLPQNSRKNETEPQPSLPQDSQKNKTEPQPPLPQTTEMKNGYQQKDETNNGEKMEDEDKVASKSNGADDGVMAHKSQEGEKEPRKGGVENDEKGKKYYELKRGGLMTGRVEMAKKLGRMMTVVVVFLSVVVLGIYVKNLIMPTKNYEK